MQALHPARIGQYDVVARLGGGGFSETWLVRDPARGDLVVAKRLRRGLIHRDPVFLDSLLTEAEIGMLVKSPHVVQILAVTDDSGEPVVVMEYVDGLRLDHLIRAAAEHGMPSEPVAEIVRQVGEGLIAIHEVCGADGTPLKVVHQDVKPSNIIVTRDGLVKLLDLGLARPQRETHDHLWVRQGTRGYRSPEQNRGDDRLTPASDLYSLGLIMCEALQGSPLLEPVDLPPPAALDRQKQIAIQMEILAPRIAAPGLDIILQRLLAFDPRDRYHSAWDLVTDIARWQRSWRSERTLPTYLKRIAPRAEKFAQSDSDTALLHRADTLPGDRPTNFQHTRASQVQEPQVPDGQGMTAVAAHSFERPTPQSGPHRGPGIPA